jgi:hypothetical protein
MSLTITNCQKVCLTITNSSCSASQPFTWNSSNTSVLGISYSNTSAIIYGISGQSGTSFVSVVDSTSTVVYSIFVTVNNYFTTSITSPQYQLAGATILNYPPYPPTNLNVSFINGSFSSYVNVSTPNLCMIAMGIAQNTLNEYTPVLGAQFVPGTNSQVILGIEPVTVASQSGVYFAMFQPIGSNVYPIIPYASSITLTTNPGQSQQNISLPNYFSCAPGSYISFVQTNYIPPSSGTVIPVSQSHLYGNGLLSIVFSNNYLNLPPSFNVSVLITPSNYYNATATDIVFSYSLSVLFQNGLIVTGVALPYSIPIGSVSWFAQLDQSSANASGVNATIVAIYQSSVNNLAFIFQNNAIVPLLDVFCNVNIIGISNSSSSLTLAA